MSIAEKNPQAFDRKTKHNRVKTKGRVLDINATLEVQALLCGAARSKNILIEHLHNIQDKSVH